jgi:class 3 adenylate cyclase
MQRIVGRLLSIGADPADDADTRLRKLLLVVAALTIAPLAVLWGLLYWIGGATGPALIPWAYTAISAIGLAAFAVTRHYTSFAISQFTPYMSLPFALMWSLGGPVDGSGVALWAGLGPIVALLLGHRRLGTALVAAYAGLIVATILVPAPEAATPPAWLRDLFFIMNLAFVPLVAFLLVRVFAGGQEGVLASVRSMVQRFLPTELVRVASTDPTRLELGGEIAEVTVMFADLGGYSTYAEQRAPAEVVKLLNRYFAAVLPAITEEGGTPMQLPGDAVFAVFGAPVAQADHAARACRAATALIERTAPFAEGPLAGPRFGIGLNSGPALVGNIGSEEFRNFTAIGDTTNVAARLQSLAGPGEIVIGPETARMLGQSVELAPMGSVQVKGRAGAVEAFRVGRRAPS